jgi:hypothetical protein
MPWSFTGTSDTEKKGRKGAIRYSATLTFVTVAMIPARGNRSLWCAKAIPMAAGLFVFEFMAGGQWQGMSVASAGNRALTSFVPHRHSRIALHDRANRKRLDINLMT